MGDVAVHQHHRRSWPELGSFFSVPLTGDEEPGKKIEIDTPTQ